MSRLPGSSRATNTIRRGDAKRIARACQHERSNHRANVWTMYAMLFWVLMCSGLIVNWLFL